MRFHVIPPGDPQVEDTRDCFLAELATKYQGWTADLDRRYDSRSVWFGVTDGGDDFCATCRLQFKSADHARIAVGPRHCGDLGRHYRPLVCEASGLSYQSTLHLLNLLHAQGQWMVANLVGDCFAFFDSSDLVLKRLATEVLGFLSIPAANVASSVVKHRATTRAVTWEVQSLSPQNLLLGLLRLQRLGATLLSDGSHNAVTCNRSAYYGPAPRVVRLC